MGSIVTAAMDGAEIGRVVGTAAALGHQMVGGIGAEPAILDNCHVRVAFATNEEQTAKRVSDARGTATEMRAMKNYGGHRLSPWLGHLMVSRQETGRRCSLLAR